MKSGARAWGTPADHSWWQARPSRTFMEHCEQHLRSVGFREDPVRVRMCLNQPEPCGHACLPICCCLEQETPLLPFTPDVTSLSAKSPGMSLPGW